MAKKKKQLSIIDFFNMELPETTEFRRILHGINGFAKEDNKPAILITSAMLAEGKSIISSFLAMTSAAAKSIKTLLIDFDLRRPMLHKLFATPIDGGVSDILSGDSFKEVIKKTSIDKLDILTSGRVVNNPSELLNVTNIHNMIKELKFYYDIILIDSPPLLPVMDPILLLEELDGAIIVVKAGDTQKDVVMRASRLLATQKDKIIGVVVNNLNHTLPYYYNHGYYGYKYQSIKS